MVAQESVGREDAAERVLAASDIVGRWWARDFKPGRTPDDLTWTQFAILSLAEAEPSINMSQVAERLELSVPTVVRAVDALERKALIKRQRSSRGGRDVRLVPTPEGRETREAVERIRHERLLDLLSKMSDDEVRGLVLGFEGMVRAVSSDVE